MIFYEFLVFLFHKPKFLFMLESLLVTEAKQKLVSYSRKLTFLFNL